MANLSGGRSRGQILLVTAFALAVAFVGLAIILNSVIFTENLATRSETTTTSEALGHARSVETGTEAVIAYVNEYNTSGADDYGPVERNLTNGVENISEVEARHQLVDGQVTNDTLLLPYYNGTWVKQTDRSRQFTNRKGAAKWSVMNTTTGGGARSFKMFLNVTVLPASLSDGLRVTADDGAGNTWELEVSDSDVRYVDSDGNTNTCSYAAGSDAAVVNVSAGTVDNATCAGLDFGRDLERINNVTFHDGDKAEGTYQLLLNKSRKSSVPPSGVVDAAGEDYDTTGGDPFTEPAVYGAKVRVEYQRRGLTYETVVEAVPGDADA